MKEIFMNIQKYVKCRIDTFCNLATKGPNHENKNPYNYHNLYYFNDCRMQPES
ncbi:hypothetical protein BACPLE_02679 [Phocaeicola plebeius DSM 17135]|uniref:Uncharacterized protein n=1 Tax=Phocaeicola plebeius (strain DSM 17135 / JCM 12973 / CCUG 54634 / M2) TaxID=484018 RepID=B5D102_PHOPM|nr:hypothetical protein BACPLE_02679 [Phocaeicola plebeius DSM 17135]